VVIQIMGSIIFFTPSAHMDADLDGVILTLISIVPKGREGIKDISNTRNWFVMVKHIIYKHNINFPYFYNKFSYLLIVFGMDSFI
jgi:hypothetical protein